VYAKPGHKTGGSSRPKNGQAFTYNQAGRLARVFFTALFAVIAL